MIALEIEAFDVSAHAGMEYCALDSASRIAPWYRRRAEDAASDAERANCLWWASVHDELASRYRMADRVMAEVDAAIADVER